MLKNKTSLNIICTVLCQITSIISGLIVPRLLLSAFGSEANGLVNSINQFLSYIALLEGGLGSVVLAALYSPLANHDEKKLSMVMKSGSRFFKQLAYIFIVYVLLLAATYPLFIKSNFTWVYISSLTIILAVSLFIQYYFSIMYKLLLQADQRMYIVQVVQILTTIVNLIIFVIALQVFPSLHVVKVLGSLMFVIQPIIYIKYIKKHYNVNFDASCDRDALSQRWDCFGQNVAYFIHTNTDVAVLSLFSSLKEVSVYSVYFLVVNSLKNFFLAFSNAFSPLVGKALAKGDYPNALETLKVYEFCVDFVSTIVFGCCIYLLPDFIMIYTNGISDANYYRPLFSIILIMAEYVYCFREPYIAVVYTAGKFKETANSAYIEAALNITISVLLVMKLGLIGIAIGTLVGMTYRMVYQVVYISKHILHRPVILVARRVVVSAVVIVASLFIINLLDTTGSDTIVLWIKNACLSVFVYTFISIVVNYVLDRRTMYLIVNKFRNKALD